MKHLFLELNEYHRIHGRNYQAKDLKGMSRVAVNMTRVQEMRPWAFLDNGTRIECTKLMMNIPDYEIIVAESLQDILKGVDALCRD